MFLAHLDCAGHLCSSVHAGYAIDLDAYAGIWGMGNMGSMEEVKDDSIPNFHNMHWVVSFPELATRQMGGMMDREEPQKIEILKNALDVLQGERAEFMVYCKFFATYKLHALIRAIEESTRGISFLERTIERMERKGKKW